MDYTVERIANKMAQEVVIAKHYLHRSAPAMFSYGLFQGMHLAGVIIFGKPASPSLCKGICGADEASRVLELTRLWIEDATPKNAESFLIGNAIKQLPSEYDILVSYAEIGAGHVGTVYQATNWLYTGMSDRHVEWRLDGDSSKHSRHIFDEHGGVNGAKKFYGERLQKHERPRKHRYVMLRGSKSRRRELTKKLKYPVQSYPKKSFITK